MRRADLVHKIERGWECTVCAERRTFVHPGHVSWSGESIVVFVFFFSWSLWTAACVLGPGMSVKGKFNGF